MQSPKLGVAGSRISLSYKGAEVPQDLDSVESKNPWQPSCTADLAQDQFLRNLAAPTTSSSKSKAAIKTKKQISGVSRIPVREKSASSKLSVPGSHDLKRTYSKKVGSLRATYSKKTAPVATTGVPQVINEAKEMQNGHNGKAIGHGSPAQLTDRCKVIMRAWHTVWWTEHREWKLIIRAECHNRYRLWLQVWQAWTSYVENSRVLHVKEKQGDQFYQRRQQRHAWDSWCRYVHLRRVEKQRKDLAVRIYQDCIIRRVWNEWRRVLECHMRHMSNMETSLHHWATELQRKVWSLWQRRLEQRRVSSFKMAGARAHYKKTCKDRVLRAWLDYLDMRRRKGHMRGVAMEMYAHRVKGRVWSQWTTRTREARQLTEWEEAVVAMGDRARVRRAVSGWKCFIAMKEHQRCLYRHADHHHSTQMKKKVLTGLTRYHQLKKIKGCYMVMARQSHTHHLMRVCWDRWMMRCEQKEEESLEGHTHKARFHASRVLKVKCFNLWVEFIGQQRKKNRQRLLADRHYRVTALPKYFSKLQMYAERQQVKREMQASSVAFRREMLLSLVFYKWWRRATLSQDVRMLERMAILHWEEKAKKHILNVWGKKTQRRLLNYQLEEVADEHRVKVVVGGVFAHWKSRLSWRRTTARRHEQAAGHYSTRLQAQTWAAWTKFVVVAREKHCQRRLASDKHHRVLLEKVLQAWKRYHNSRMAKLSMGIAMATRYHAHLQRRVLREWMSTVEEVKLEREMHRLASTHHTSVILTKVVRLWREVSIKKQESRCEKEQWVESARRQLAVARAGRLFDKWRVMTVEKKRLQEKMVQSDRKYRSILIRRILTAWQSRVKHARRKAELSRKGAWFERCRLLAHYYCKWRVQLMCALEDGQKQTLALWQWSYVVQHKVFLAWLGYTRERKRKADRYARAIARHRLALLSMGVKQWITVASSWKAEREAAVLSLHTQHAQKVLRCVKRCIRHWRQLTNKHRPPTLRLQHSTEPSLLPHPPSLQPYPPSSDSVAASSVWTALTRDLRLPGNSQQIKRPAPCQMVITQSHFSQHLTTPPQPSTAAQPRPHPLRSQSVKEQMMAMRSKLQELLRMKTQLKLLMDEVTADSSKETELEEEIDCLKVLIQEREPVLRDIAQGISGLVELYT